MAQAGVQARAARVARARARLLALEEEEEEALLLLLLLLLLLALCPQALSLMRSLWTSGLRGSCWPLPALPPAAVPLQRQGWLGCCLQLQLLLWAALPSWEEAGLLLRQWRLLQLLSLLLLLLLQSWMMMPSAPSWISWRENH